MVNVAQSSLVILADLIGLEKLQSEGLLDLADVAVAVKDETGKAKLHHAGNLLAEGVCS